MSAATRLRILKYYLSGRWRDVPLLDIVNYMVQPSTQQKGMQFIREIRPEGEVERVRFKDQVADLLWPAGMPRANLYGTVFEIFSRARCNWHYYQVPETMVRPGDVVADCGAAEGLFTLRVAGSCKEVVVIEPNPRFVASLRKLFDGTPNVSIIPCALAAEPGRAVITDMCSGSHVSSTKTGFDVEVTTIDKIFFDARRRLDYFKADLEGFEQQTLQGARRTIHAYRPRIAITTYHKGNDYRMMVDEIHSIVPEYKWKVKGIEWHEGKPVMLHMWCE